MFYNLITTYYDTAFKLWYILQTYYNDLFDGVVRVICTCEWGVKQRRMLEVHGVFLRIFQLIFIYKVLTYVTYFNIFRNCVESMFEYPMVSRASHSFSFFDTLVFYSVFLRVQITQSPWKPYAHGTPIDLQ